MYHPMALAIALGYWQAPPANRKVFSNFRWSMGYASKRLWVEHPWLLAMYFAGLVAVLAYAIWNPDRGLAERLSGIYVVRRQK